MLNEYADCPRLFHLMHVDGRWADNAYTAEGREVHRRVDQLDHVLLMPTPVTEKSPMFQPAPRTPAMNPPPSPARSASAP